MNAIIYWQDKRDLN